MEIIDWEARDDAYSLIRSEEIKADRKRLVKASLEVDKIAKEKEEELRAIQKVSNQKKPIKKFSNNKFFTNDGLSKPIKLSK